MPAQSRQFIALVLGTIGALGPLAIDMYIPGMPQIAAELKVGAGAIQFSLMSFFCGLMIGQLFYGPLSDRTGRKPMIYLGLSIFIIASLGCAMSDSASQLITWRFIQGTGGSIGMVTGLAIVRDLFTGREAVKLVALIMIVTGVAPIIAPMLGTGIMTVADWPMIFIGLSVYGVICLVFVTLFLPETRSKELRATSHPLAALYQYRQLLKSRNYISCVAVQSLTQAGFFAYLAGSSFVFISLFGMSPANFSIFFAINAVGMVGGSQLSPRLMKWFTPGTITKWMLVIYTFIAAGLVLLESSEKLTFLFLAAGLFILIFAMAAVLPLNGMMALEAHGAVSGAAAALMGALQFGAGSLASFVVGATANGTAGPMIITIAACGCSALLIAWLAFPNQKLIS